MPPDWRCCAAVTFRQLGRWRARLAPPKDGRPPLMSVSQRARERRDAVPTARSDAVPTGRSDAVLTARSAAAGANGVSQEGGILEDMSTRRRSPVLVGRAEHLAALDAALDRAR